MKSNYEINEEYKCPSCGEFLGTEFYKTNHEMVDSKIRLLCPFCGFKDKEMCFQCRNRDVYCADCIHLD